MHSEFVIAKSYNSKTGYNYHRLTEMDHQPVAVANNYLPNDLEWYGNMPMHAAIRKALVL